MSRDVAFGVSHSAGDSVGGGVRAARRDATAATDGPAADANPPCRRPASSPSSGAATASTNTWDAAAVARHGLLAGLLSGVIFSAAASGAAVLQGKAWDAPVRLVAAVALGPGAFEPSAPLLPVLAWGMALHLLYTAVTGILLAWLVAAVRPIRRSAVATVAASLAYAAVMWLSWFYVIAPALGWGWFPQRTEFLPQLVLQVSVWGGSLGMYFAAGRVRRALTGGAAAPAGQTPAIR